MPKLHGISGLRGILLLHLRQNLLEHFEWHFRVFVQSHRFELRFVVWLTVLALSSSLELHQLFGLHAEKAGWYGVECEVPLLRDLLLLDMLHVSHDLPEKLHRVLSLRICVLLILLLSLEEVNLLVVAPEKLRAAETVKLDRLGRRRPTEAAEVKARIVERFSIEKTLSEGEGWAGAHKLILPLGVDDQEASFAKLVDVREFVTFQFWEQQVLSKGNLERSAPRHQMNERVLGILVILPEVASNVAAFIVKQANWYSVLVNDDLIIRGIQ